MTDEKKHIRLKIAFISDNARLTHLFFDDFVRVNADEIQDFNMTRGRVIFQDGTEVIRVTPNRVMDGYRFDQVVVAQCDRAPRCGDLRPALCQLRMRLTQTVPEEFQFIIYNPDEEGQT